MRFGWQVAQFGFLASVLIHLARPKAELLFLQVVCFATKISLYNACANFPEYINTAKDQ